MRITLQSLQYLNLFNLIEFDALADVEVKGHCICRICFWLVSGGGVGIFVGINGAIQRFKMPCAIFSATIETL